MSTAESPKAQQLELQFDSPMEFLQKMIDRGVTDHKTEEDALRDYAMHDRDTGEKFDSGQWRWGSANHQKFIEQERRPYLEELVDQATREGKTVDAVLTERREAGRRLYAEMLAAIKNAPKPGRVMKPR